MKDALGRRPYPGIGRSRQHIRQRPACHTSQNLDVGGRRCTSRTTGGSICNGNVRPNNLTRRAVDKREERIGC
jgi:hypothetical protein